MKINIQPELKRYYIALGGLGILVLGVILVNIFGSAGLKHDYKLERKIGDIQQGIDSHVASKRKLPDILPDVGIKESGGVEYKKIAEDRYMLCASFKTKSDGYSAPDPGYLNEVQSESLKSGVALDVNTHFTNGNSQGLKHEKGYSCIVYQPYQLTDAFIYPYSLCSTGKYKEPPLYYQVIQSVNPATKQVTVGKDNAYRPKDDYNYGTTVPSAKTYTLSADAKIYDSQCNEVALGTLKPGDAIEIYQRAAGLTVDGIRLNYSSTPPLPVKPGTNQNNNLQ